MAGLGLPLPSGMSASSSIHINIELEADGQSIRIVGVNEGGQLSKAVGPLAQGGQQKCVGEVGGRCPAHAVWERWLGSHADHHPPSGIRSAHNQLGDAHFIARNRSTGCGPATDSSYGGVQRRAGILAPQHDCRREGLRRSDCLHQGFE
eukprot:3902676-Rhodomonas_salina.2